MGLSTLAVAEYEAGRYDAATYTLASAGLDAVYAALADENAYDPHRLQAALDALAAALPISTSNPP